MGLCASAQQNDEQIPPIITAAQAGNSVTVKQLIQQGVNVNKTVEVPVEDKDERWGEVLGMPKPASRPTTSRSSLSVAAAQGNAPIVKLLLEAGADPKFRSPRESGRLLVPPIVEAAGSPSNEVAALSTCRALLERPGADANYEIQSVWNLPADGTEMNRAEFKYSNTGYSALHHAASRGYRDVCELLIEHKADPNRQTTDSGNTPLHEAVRADGRYYSSTTAEARSKTVIFLLRVGGVDQSLKDKQGRSWRECADASLLEQVGPSR